MHHFNLKKAVDPRNITQALVSLSYMKKACFTNQVKTTFFIRQLLLHCSNYAHPWASTLFKTISRILIARPTAFSRFKVLTLFLMFFYSVLGFASSVDIVSTVLEAESKSDIYGTTNPSIDEIKFYWSVSDQLVGIILHEPENNDAWIALHKFREFTDASIIGRYKNSCYSAIKSEPLIFYRRYVLGDDLALDRTIDAIAGEDVEQEQQSKIVKYHISLFSGLVRTLKEIESENPRHDTYLNKLEWAVIKYIEQTSDVVIE